MKQSKKKQSQIDNDIKDEATDKTINITDLSNTQELQQVISDAENEKPFESLSDTEIEILASKRPAKVSTQQVLAALELSGFNYTKAAIRLGISVYTLRRIADQSDIIKDIDRCSSLQLLELAEIQAIKLVAEGDKEMIKFVLEGKGYVKGWQTRGAPQVQTQNNIQVNTNDSNANSSKSTLVLDGKEWEL